MSLDPIPWEALEDGHLQLSEKVAMFLREQIVSGELMPGTFLRIESIAKSLRVSPTPVREGLLLLKSEALVRLIPRRGFIVASFTKQDLLDLFWAQATIGAELAARAAISMPKDTIEELHRHNQVYERAIAENNEAQIARLGHEFHRMINLSTGSTRLAYMLGALTRQLPNRFYASIEGQLHLAEQYHPIILGAIRVRDADAARSLMFRHINEAGARLVETLEQRGLWGPVDAPPAAEQSEPPMVGRQAQKPRAAAPQPAKVPARKRVRKTA